ncbi:MAG: glycoside hydrolase family 15 protein [Actinomycetota bacterium]|nr:glycoside hydrolase family 15 protein [Actinomycetota bacterium]
MTSHERHHSDAAFTPLTYHDGYPPLEDVGLVGDGRTSALVARDGAVVWLCLPRFDSDPLFCSLLDARRGGSFRIAPEEVVEARQRYEPDTGVLVTELRSTTGLLRLTDCMTLRAGADLTEDTAAGRGELLRSVAVLDGAVRVHVDLEPRRGARGERCGLGLRISCLGRPDLDDLRLLATVPLDGLRTSVELRAGQQEHFLLRWGSGGHGRDLHPPALLQATLDGWRRWMRHLDYDGPQNALVRRSVVTLKMLDFVETGALVAAPTSSLPETIGGVRNWDYRYAWVRDAAFSVYAFRRVGLHAEARAFLGWVLDAIERDGKPRVLYSIDGVHPPEEREDPELEGYRRSAPVRWGNAAADQRQHDAYGEILDCAYQWVAAGGELDEYLWARLRALVDEARVVWDQPDHGIWEVRSATRPFTYSAAMCQVALDRGARLAERFGLPGDVAGWRAEATKIQDAILDKAWDPDRQSFTEHLGPGGLDASLLALPLRRVVDARHPKMKATVTAITERLGAGDGLLYRYLLEESDDGLPGHEGAFLLCSFWLVDNLAKQGRLDEAMALYESLCARGGALGLLPEEIDPETGGFLGNHPQAFSHVGVVSSGMNLARELRTGRDVSGVRAPA